MPQNSSAYNQITAKFNTVLSALSGESALPHVNTVVLFEMLKYLLEKTTTGAKDLTELTKVLDVVVASLVASVDDLDARVTALELP